MSDKYHDLLFNHDLYPSGFINNFGIEGKHWRVENNRQRELSLRHDMVCLLLCNLEKLPYIEILKSTLQDPGSVERKRKRTESVSNLLEEERIKIFKADSEAPGTSTSQSITGHSISTPSIHSSTSSEGIEDNLYRFILIEGMPKPELLQNMYAEEWGIQSPESMWDIADRFEKAFIEVKVTRNRERAIQSWKEQSVGLLSHTSLYIVDPDTGLGEWHGKTKRAKGEAKVTKFILTRREIMRNLSILDSEIQEQSNLTAHIFVSEYFNKMVSEWTEDWWPSNIDNLQPEEKLEYVSKVPKAIQPKVLLKSLSNLKEDDRNNYIYWRGKIHPDGWTHNIMSFEETDSAMMNDIFEFISKEKWQLSHLDTHERDIDFLRKLSELWNSGDRSTFKLDGSWDSIFREDLKSMLGIGYKSLMKENTEDKTSQPEYRFIRKRKYHNWFDETIRRLNLPHNINGEPYHNLKDLINTDDHPLTKICGSMAREMVNGFLKTNSALYSSKMTNFYSRMGGAYINRKNIESGISPSIAIFPLYATLTSNESEGNSTKRRAISGFVVRGPHHARSSTDRTNFISVEFFKNDPQTVTYLKYQKKTMVYSNSEYIMLIRKNSIIREDPSYLTFNINSMFLPFNLFGVMTLENPFIAPNTDMKILMKNLWDHSIYWFVERFTEGVVMSAIGTSRDEGYFAQLRKLFMLILAWRRQETGACWDIVAYTAKVNECLIDNPLSMHFHKTILKLLNFYSE